MLDKLTPTQKIKVIAMTKASTAFVAKAVNSEYGIVLLASCAFSAVHIVSHLQHFTRANFSEPACRSTCRMQHEQNLLICTLLSYPTNTDHAVKTPTNVAPVAEPHSPPSVKVNKTSDALPRGLVTQRVTMIASHAAQWIMSIIPSRRGNFFVTAARQHIRTKHGASGANEVGQRKGEYLQ